VPEELSPHDETVLFRLVEYEVSLPRDEQSRRFSGATISQSLGEAPEALIRGAVSSKQLIMKADDVTFQALRESGYISGGEVLINNEFSGWIDVSPFRLCEPAFRYYNEKHDFPTSLSDERREFVDSEVSTVYPEVVAHLKRAYDAVWIEQPEDNWSGVAHSCQNALKAFAQQVYKSEYASRLGAETPSSTDFEEMLEQTIRANSSGDELKNLLVKFNRYANARRHDIGTTREEAKRCVLLTYLLIAEIYELLRLSEAT